MCSVENDFVVGVGNRCLPEKRSRIQEMKDKLEVKMKEEMKSKLMEQQQNQFAHGGTQVEHNLVDDNMPKHIYIYNCRDQDIRST